DVFGTQRTAGLDGFQLANNVAQFGPQVLHTPFVVEKAAPAKHAFAERLPIEPSVTRSGASFSSISVESSAETSLAVDDSLPPSPANWIRERIFAETYSYIRLLSA